MRFSYSNEQLDHIARDNYEVLRGYCAVLEREGYWDGPRNVLKQSIYVMLDMYVQTVLLRLAIYCNRLRREDKRFIADLPDINVYELTTGNDDDKRIEEQTDRFFKSPPILLQLCGLRDTNKGSGLLGLFFDALLNIQLALAFQDSEKTSVVAAFIRDYYSKIEVFLGSKDNYGSIVNERYIFKKLCSEDLENSADTLRKCGDSFEKYKQMMMLVSPSETAAKWAAKGEHIMRANPQKTYRVYSSEDDYDDDPEDEYSEYDEYDEYDEYSAYGDDDQNEEASGQEDEYGTGENRNSGDGTDETLKREIEPVYESPRDGLNEKKEKVLQAGVNVEPVNNRESLAMKKVLGDRGDGDALSTGTELDKLLTELDELVGLAAVKEEVRSLINLIKVRALRKKHNMPLIEMSFHMVFTGNPGTGKTTVARLIAAIYRELGLLSKGQLIESDRSGLVAGYVGQTAIKVREVVEKALGGVLFIDEAYSLKGNAQNDFGDEAIETLVKMMEDHRDDLVVIVAGYNNEMREFLKSNTGLTSRFNRFITFEDYTTDELVRIMDSMALKAGFKMSPEARQKVVDYVEGMDEKKRNDFGNARGIRNLFERVVVNQANRISRIVDPTYEELEMIIDEDVMV